MSTAAAGALAVAGTGGAAFVVMDDFSGWVHEILAHSLPGYELEPEGLALFIDQYSEKKGRSAKLRLYAAAEGVTEAQWALPQDFAEDVEVEERKILSDFLIGSDFFEGPTDKPKLITFRGLPEACGNPFATF